MKSRNFFIDVVPVEQETLSAKQFLELTRKNPGIIKSSEVVPPAAGKDGFGAFMVKYTRPIYKQPA